MDSQVEKIADIVGSAYENWYGERVFLDCGPEAGVEEFVLEQVCPMAAATGKEILYLTNTGHMQAQKERRNSTEAEKALRVMDYSEFEQMVQYHVAYDGQYDYIFAEGCGVLLESKKDPAHSALIYDFLMQSQRSAVIFVGANAKGLREYLIRSGKMPKENLFALPNRNIAPEKLVFVQKERGKLTGAKLAQELLLSHPEQRVAYFCGSKEKLRGAAKMLRGVACWEEPGDSQLNGAARLMAQEGRLYAASNLLLADGRQIAPDLCLYGFQHVITDLFDMDQVLSCLSAIKPEGRLTLYIVEYNGTQLRYLRGLYESQMENLSLFEQMERGEGGEFLRRSQNPRFLAENPIFFIGHADEYGNCRYQVNARQRALCEIALAVLDAIKEQGYRGYVQQALGVSTACKRLHLPRLMLEKEARAELLARLDQQQGRKLAGEELEHFRRYLCNAFARKSISVSMANELFEKLHVPYRVLSKKERARTSPFYNHHYWILERLPA